MVMSIGWNPYFDNTEKTIEPWLLHKFDEDFYGEELHLVIVGYIRPEVCFINHFCSLSSLKYKVVKVLLGCYTLIKTDFVFFRGGKKVFL
ncbi:putative riboflavin kinase [Helianthus annuus]|nr:putative riboflavin kinase [Helianthus annuus]KAJ0748941.1 putative riboflavin kinase [Helianthus annuus]